MYASRVNWFFGVGATFRLAGSLVGSDKLGHFFSQGIKYYGSHLLGWDDRHVYGRGRFNERWLFGQLTTSVYSNADLVANYEGYRFYRSLFEAGIVPGKGPIVAFRDGRATIERSFSWADHVNDYWDEAAYPSHISPGLEHYLLSALPPLRRVRARPRRFPAPARRRARRALPGPGPETGARAAHGPGLRPGRRSSRRRLARDVRQDGLQPPPHLRFPLRPAAADLAGRALERGERRAEERQLRGAVLRAAPLAGSGAKGTSGSIRSSGRRAARAPRARSTPDRSVVVAAVDDRRDEVGVVEDRGGAARLGAGERQVLELDLQPRHLVDVARARAARRGARPGRAPPRPRPAGRARSRAGRRARSCRSTRDRSGRCGAGERAAPREVSGDGESGEQQVEQRGGVQLLCDVETDVDDVDRDPDRPVLQPLARLQELGGEARRRERGVEVGKAGVGRPREQGAEGRARRRRRRRRAPPRRAPARGRPRAGRRRGRRAATPTSRRRRPRSRRPAARRRRRAGRARRRPRRARR